MNEILLAIRLPLAVILVGYLPGAALVYALFPARTLNRVERFYLGTLASLCLSALTAYALARLTGGMTAARLFGWLGGLTLIFAVVGSVRALLAEEQHLDWRQRQQQIHTKFAALHALHTRITPFPVTAWLPRRHVGAVGLMCVLALGVFAAYNDADGYALTEFYLSPSLYTGNAVEYTQLAETLILPVTVVNREDRTFAYRFEAQIDDQIVNLPTRLFLADRETWTGDLTIPLAVGAAPQRVDLLLYSANSADTLRTGTTIEPLARLRLWLQDESTTQRE